MPLSPADAILFGLLSLAVVVAVGVELWDGHKMKRWRKQRRRKTER